MQDAIELPRKGLETKELICEIIKLCHSLLNRNNELNPTALVYTDDKILQFELTCRTDIEKQQMEEFLVTNLYKIKCQENILATVFFSRILLSYIPKTGNIPKEIDQEEHLLILVISPVNSLYTIIKIERDGERVILQEDFIVSNCDFGSLPLNDSLSVILREDVSKYFH